MTNPYTILGVSRGATSIDIKKAYRRLALKYHPDKTTGDEEKFKQLVTAYEAIRNPVKQENYDVSSSKAASRNRNYVPTSKQRIKFVGDNLYVSEVISFIDALFGTTLTLNIESRVSCSKCKGTGAESFQPCTDCEGTGLKSDSNYFLSAACDTCAGSGILIKKTCVTCMGRGAIKETSDIDVVIPAGSLNLTLLRVRKKGNSPVINNNVYSGAIHKGIVIIIYGDIFLNIDIKDHSIFSKGLTDTLTSSYTISYLDAIVGGDLVIDVIDKKKLIKKTVAFRPGTQQNDFLTVAGYGIPSNPKIPQKRGDLIVTIRIKVPSIDSLPLEEQALLLQLKKLRDKS